MTNGASVRIPTTYLGDRRLPLTLAVQYGSLELVAVLLAREAKADAMTLSIAGRYAKSAVVQLLIDVGMVIPVLSRLAFDYRADGTSTVEIALSTQPQLPLSDVRDAHHTLYKLDDYARKLKNYRAAAYISREMRRRREQTRDQQERRREAVDLGIVCRLANCGLLRIGAPAMLRALKHFRFTWISGVVLFETPRRRVKRAKF